ncbi:CASP2 [Branchiostoma lanceolatum]|nr:CASP2 [Branchiostoma lanceolatum]
MAKKPRGSAFILCNTKFPGHPNLGERIGGHVDVTNMSKLMEGLSFQTDIVKEKTAQGIKDEVRRFTERKDHKDAEGSIVVLMSHGEEGKIYGTDGQLVALEVIFAMFDENICLRLKGKPKLFFIQACRGNKVYRGPSSAPEDEADSSWETVNLDLMGELKGLLGRTSLGQDEGDAPQPEQRPHVFCGYATRLGYLSFRNTADGSWFIHAITSVFMKNAKDKSLVEMMDKVKENLLTRKANSSDPKFQGGREESVYLSSLQKDLYFFPGQ